MRIGFWAANVVFTTQMLFPWMLIVAVSAVVLLRHVIVTHCLKRKDVLLLSPHDNDNDTSSGSEREAVSSQDGLVWDVQRGTVRSDEELEKLRADG